MEAKEEYSSCHCLKSVLDIARSRLTKYLRWLHQNFAKPSWSGWSGRSWLHVASDWMVSLWCHGSVIGCCFRRHLTDVGKVAKEMASLTEDEIEVCTVSVWGSADTLGPIWSHLQEQKWKKRCTSANCQSIWLVQLDGLTLFILRTEVTEDIFVKWAFDKSAKVY